MRDYDLAIALEGFPAGAYLMQKRSASLADYDAVAMNAEPDRPIDPADVRTAHKNGKLTVIQGVEGAPF